MRKKNNVKNTKFNLFSNWKQVIILVFIALPVLGFTINKFGFNKGVDFSGGTIIEATCNKCNIETTVKQLEKELKTSVKYQKIDNSYLLKTTTEKNHENTLSVFKKILKNNKMTIVAMDFVSPQMTKTFINDSIFACVFAFICIGLYIILRFNWRFSISAILALSLDIFMTITFISITQVEICLITLTALLTIIGYCINDKIILLDKVNENLFCTEKTIPEILAKSSKSVLFRSIFTSLTTVIASASLLFFGNRSIYELGTVIIFGILIGTITSLTVLPYLLLIFKIKHKTNLKIERSPMWYAS